MATYLHTLTRYGSCTNIGGGQFICPFHATVTLDELDIYGSSRLGTYEPTKNLIAEYDAMLGYREFRVPYYDTVTNIVNLTIPESDTFSTHLGQKKYELCDHLGNVLTTISDRKLEIAYDDTLTNFTMPDVVASQDYYAFGMQMPGRIYQSDDYRFGYNGMEQDDDMKGEGNSYTSEYRQLDPRLARWFSIDPLSNNSPWQSPYVAFDNNPIWKKDPHGDETPGVKDIIAAGKQSKQFDLLLQQANVTDENAERLIKIKEGTDPYTGKKIITSTSAENAHITLTNAATVNAGVIKLAHELTNRINIKATRELVDQVRLGIITPEEFAEKSVDNEAESVLNQIVVASELDIISDLTKISPGLSFLATAYKEKKMTKEEVLNVLKARIVKSMTDENGQNIIDRYKQDGKDMREEYLANPDKRKLFNPALAPSDTPQNTGEPKNDKKDE